MILKAWILGAVLGILSLPSLLSAQEGESRSRRREHRIKEIKEQRKKDEAAKAKAAETPGESKDAATDSEKSSDNNAALDEDLKKAAEKNTNSTETPAPSDPSTSAPSGK